MELVVRVLVFVIVLYLVGWLICRLAGWRPPNRSVRVRSSVTVPHRPRRRVREDVPHALYVYPHALRPGGRYYGISNEPEVRHGRHLNDPDDQWWLATSTREMVILRWYPNRTAARAGERGAVRAAAFAGEDIANDHHHPFRVRSRRARAVR